MPLVTLSPLKSASRSPKRQFYTPPTSPRQYVPLDCKESTEFWEPQTRMKRLPWIVWPCHLLSCVLAAVLGRSHRRVPKPSSTSYLNGIRAIACLIVHNHHVLFFDNPALENPYGAGERNFSILQLPIVRLIHAGRSMVCVFFVLSGFVLAYSPLRKIASISPASSSDFISGLSSSIIRRFVRLFLPLLVTVYITCLVTWVNPWYYPGHWRDAEPTLWQHHLRFFHIAVPFLNPFTWDIYRPQGLDHCWTLALEYRGSMIVFLLCLTTSQLTTASRKLALCTTALWAFCYGRWEVTCFISGMFLAELRYHPLSCDFPLLHRIHVSPKIKSVSAAALFVLSLFLLSWPDNGSKGVEPFVTMSRFMPTMWVWDPEMGSWYWGSIGAFALILSVENLPCVQAVLSKPPILYLGEISYSFYLLHWMAFAWFGTMLNFFFTVVLEWSPTLSFYLVWGITVAVLVAVSDVFWRLVDKNSIVLGNLLAAKLGLHKQTATVMPLHIYEERQKDNVLMNM
ncbi:acyltransferase family-domain-containing protein [Xylariales sp. PMI_506]|nr:acyltransferase family-domain-containing protein [Xylariales sp. PMI_506]